MKKIFLSKCLIIIMFLVMCQFFTTPAYASIYVDDTEITETDIIENAAYVFVDDDDLHVTGNIETPFDKPSIKAYVRSKGGCRRICKEYE